MKLKKMFIVSFTLLSMSSIVSPFFNSYVRAQEQENIEVDQLTDHSINPYDYDSYVALDAENYQYYLVENAVDELTEHEYNALSAMINDTNSMTSQISVQENETIFTADKEITITQYTEDSGAPRSYAASEPQYNEGINQVQVYWWGVRVWLSGSTVRNIGQGVTIAGIWIPEPLVSKVLATAGVVLSVAPGGIVFNTSPHLAIPGTPLSALSFWGLEFQ